MNRVEEVRQLGREHARLAPPLTRTQFLDWFWLDIGDHVNGYSASDLYALYLSNRAYIRRLPHGPPLPVSGDRGV